MAKAKLKANLSEKSLENLQKELANLVKALNKSTDKSTKELGQKSLEYMQKQYSMNKMDNHIDNINLKSYKHRYKKGFIISSGNDEIAIYNEYGTGVVGEGTNKLAAESGYEYNVQSPYKGVIPEGAIKQYGKAYCERVTDQNTWWYFKNNKWWHTKGMKGKNMYSSLVDNLRQNAIKGFKTSISETIGSYGGK